MTILAKMNRSKKQAERRANQLTMWGKIKLLHWINKNKDTMLAKLKSRKLWAAIVGSVIVTLGDQLGLTPEVIQWVATIATGYIVGQGIADAGANGGSQGV